MKMFVRKLFTITLPLMLVALVIVAVGAEVWIRATWDPRRGTPGFFLSDPVLIQRMAPFYDGWFAGVPVRTNNLGFRDQRDYAIEKSARTVRILVLGDSITFGYGSVYEHTYPYLLKQQLGEWRPDVDWQVWNTGVPGYSTSQELAYLQRVGPQFDPDLVIVGFSMNDVMGNVRREQPGPAQRVASAVKNFVKPRLYSYDLYRKIRYVAGETLFRSQSSLAYLAALANEQATFAVPDATISEEQQLTYPDAITDPQLTTCDAAVPTPTGVAVARTSVASVDDQGWLSAVSEFQQLNRSGTYRVIFFVNAAPNQCQKPDRFYDGDMKLINDIFVNRLSEGGTLVVSSYEEFKKYRPSQMPMANWHSLGNTNWVKASLLFDVVQGYLPARLPRLGRAVSP